MIIRSHRKFDKQISKLSVGLRKKLKKVLAIFTINPHHPSLKNHKLTGSMQDKRAIWVNCDVRIIFEEHDGYVLVIFLEIGGHDVYKP